MPYSTYPPRSSSAPASGGGGSYNNRRGDSGREESLTTNGVFFSNSQAGKILNVNYWSKTVSLEISAVPAGATLTWDMRKNIQPLRQVLSFHTISELATICDDILDEIKKTGTFTNAGVIGGSKKDAIVEISTGENLKLNPGIYLVIYKGLDNSGRTNTVEFYPFGGTRIIRNYNHTTGQMTEDISSVGEFKKFIKILHNAEDAFTMAQAHAIADLKKSDKMAVFKTLAAVSAALGVDMTKDLMEKKTTGSSTYTRNQNPPGGASGYQKRSGGYQHGSYNAPRNNPGNRSTFENPNANYQAAMSAIGDAPVDLNLDVASLQNVTLDQFPQ